MFNHKLQFVFIHSLDPSRWPYYELLFIMLSLKIHTSYEHKYNLTEQAGIKNISTLCTNWSRIYVISNWKRITEALLCMVNFSLICYAFWNDFPSRFLYTKIDLQLKTQFCACMCEHLCNNNSFKYKIKFNLFTQRPKHK